MPAVVGPHAPGRGKGVEGLGRWLGDIVTAVGCCCGCKGQNKMPSCGKTDATHAPGKGGELDKANLSPPGFFLDKVRTGHMRWMKVILRVLFILKIRRGSWEKRSHANKRTTKDHAGCTTTSTDGRAHRTAHFIAGRDPAACIYFRDFRPMRLTHRAVDSKAYVNKM